ncbi:MAG: hypothetical protein PHT58_04125 [Eubacteriales bacterium]|nr:hypothetical protein [Eubacteriales bacterium]
MKKTIAIILTLMLTVCLIPTIANAAGEYTLTGDKGFQTNYSVDAQGNVLWTAKISSLGESVRISSLQFVVSWDKTQLTVIGTSAAELYYMSQGKVKVADISESVTDETDAVQEWTAANNFGTLGCNYNYATASSYGLTVPGDGVTIITLAFKVNAAVAAGTQMNIAISGFGLTLVDASDTAISTSEYTLAAADGYITAGSAPVDKTQLQALYNTDLAAMTGVVASDEPNKLADGTRYLSQAQITANNNALAAAKTVLDNTAATQAQIDAAYTALNTAFVMPKTVSVNVANLQQAIEYAQAFIASADFTNEEKVSTELQAKWTAALASAQGVLANTAHTQNQCDAATTAIYALDKTGEDIAVYAFAGVSILALMGLAVALRRKFN